MPKVSVIVPNYNHERYLEKRLDSIFNQTFQDFEVILLDDCSTDNSVGILAEYAKLQKVSHFVINEINSGSPFKQWKKGIDLAQGEYIWIAESDDWADDRFLEVLLNCFEVNENVVLSFCNSNWIDDRGNSGKDLSIYSESFIRSGEEEIKKRLSVYNTIQNVSSVLFNARILKKVDTNYTEYKSSGDWILYFEILKHGKFCYINKRLNNFRWYHANVSNEASKKGLWIYEGVDVLNSAKSVKFNKSEKNKILLSWFKKVKELRVSIPISLKKLIKVNFKLFQFAPFIFIKLKIRSFVSSTFK